ncbi:hypothetical protein GGR55DRAFT_622434 [Xylaria sp. FL0064]|nr:hypothetical protein GGR55DRAFT_622434 [Xylaria sp. FL0064]
MDCSTGNCTLPAFSTIAVCHACQDIKDLIIFGNEISEEGGRDHSLPEASGFERLALNQDVYVCIPMMKSHRH